MQRSLRAYHSYEELRQPILMIYSSIRCHDSIALVAGSGFGGLNGTFLYLSGNWSKQFGVVLMPFDGFLFSSWVMLAKEAHKSPSNASIKDLIIAMAGVDELQWEGTPSVCSS